MLGSVKRSVVSAMKRTSIGNLYLLGMGYAGSSGWLRSSLEGSPVTADGGALPWITLPAIRFLDERLPAGLRVFEWGSGNSTRWWAAHASEVRSCEHVAEWYERVRSTMPGNVEIELHALEGGGYVDAISGHGAFDVVMVDGRERVACARRALEHLSPHGIVVWDDSQRDRYHSGLADCEQRGFSRVDFYGLQLGSYHESRTSILYRSGANVLSL